MNMNARFDDVVQCDDPIKCFWFFYEFVGHVLVTNDAPKLARANT